MTQNSLRLVVDHRDDDTAPADMERRPASGAALHIHLHMASSDAQLPATSPALASETRGRGRLGRGVTRPLLVGVAGALVAVVAFDLGARSGAGHAEALVAAKTSAAGLASFAATPPGPQPAAAPGELPASVQHQLAQRPTVTLPPRATPSGGGTDAFGLQR